MKYSNFEVMALAVGGLAILVTIITQDSTTSEIIGQALILLPLLGGLHFGRKGAVVSFLAAVVAYGVVSMTLVEDSSTAFQLFIFRTVVYGVVALVAGELNVRLKYLFVRLENSAFVDHLTSLYNGRYMKRLIDKHISEFDRYGSGFSLAVIEIDDDVFAPLKKAVRNKRIKETGASIIKPGIRGTDEAGRLDTGEFMLLFPRTDKDGARVAVKRISSRVRWYLQSQDLDAEEDGVRTTVYEWPVDMEEINGISACLPSEISSEKNEGDKGGTKVVDRRSPSV